MKRKFTLTIELENAAFDGDAHLELSHLLMKTAEAINMDGLVGAGNETDYGAAMGLWDSNGNWCGHWRAVLDERAEDPSRWESFAEAELQTLRGAINLRLCQLHAGGRECDCQEQKESIMLGELDRAMARECDRRNQ
jgi:hypothetical protein